jgi:hypothetical protein
VVSLTVKKWQVAIFLAGWLLLGLFATAVNNLGAGEGHEPTTTASETAH